MFTKNEFFVSVFFFLWWKDTTSTSELNKSHLMNYSDFWEHSPIQYPLPTGTNLHSPNTNSENTERQRGKGGESGGEKKRDHTYITPHPKNILLQSSEYTSRHLKT